MCPEIWFSWFEEIVLNGNEIHAQLFFVLKTLIIIIIIYHILLTSYIAFSKFIAMEFLLN